MKARSNGNAIGSTHDADRATCVTAPNGDLRAKLREKGQPYDRACVIFEVCRPDVARRTLESAPEIAVALPCRIAAIERADGTRALATLDPHELLGLVGAAGAGDLAPEVDRALRNILTRSA